MIQLPFVVGGSNWPMNLSVILDPVNGHTLVDTGLPGQQDPPSIYFKRFNCIAALIR